MTSILLLTYAVLAGTWGARWLREARWQEAAPRLAIAAWQALASSVLLAVGAAGLAMAISFPHVSDDLARLLDLCADSLQHGYASPGGVVAALAGMSIFLALLARVAWCTVRATASDRRERNARVRVLDLIGRRDQLPGALVIDHDAPYAFCVGGRCHRVVVTSGLLATLSEHELQAVLAHEEAHLRQRHHLAILTCRALFATLSPVFPAFRQAMPLIKLHAELSADDAARDRVGVRHLRSALTTLACGPAPAGTLAATANDVETRLLRLSGGPRRLGPLGASVTAVGIGVTVMVPLALAAAPALAMAWEGLCRIT